MSSSSPRWWLTPSAIFRYGVAVLSVTAALIIAWWMEFAWQSAAHASLFLCAVMFSAWFGGIRPGLLAIALSVLAFDYYFLAMEIKQLPRLLMFALSAFFVALLSAAQRRAAESLRDARDDLHRTVQDLQRINEALQVENAERKRAEDALRKSDSYLAEAQKLSQTGSFGWNVSTGEIFWSAETHRIAGYDLATKPTVELILQRIHPEDIARLQEILDRASKGGTDLDFEHRFLMTDGSVKYVHVLAHAVPDQSGNIEYVGAAMDITAARRAADELRKSEEKYRDLVDLSPDAISVVDKEGNFVSANPAGLELLRCAAQDVAGMPVAETYLPEERAKHWERLKKLNAGARLRFERIFVRKDATQVPVEVSSSSMRHGYSQVVVRDISERKRAETELRRSEAYLAEAQKLSRTGSWAAHADLLKSTYWSAEMFRIMGFPIGDNPPTNEEVSKHFTPEAWAGILELFETARRNKAASEGEFPMVLPDGSNRMIRIVGHPVLDEAGDIVEFVGTTIDITEQRQARAALETALAEIKKSEDKLQIIIDTIPTLAWCTLPDGSAEFLNQRWLDYTGLSVEEARNWGWTVVLHLEDSTHLMDKWRASVATGEPFEAEARFRRADGTYRWCLARAVPLRDELGNIIRWYGTNTDIEDLKRAEEELHKARVELAHVTRVTTLGEMTASIAHEINQPLAAVVNNASACLRWLAAHNLEEARRSAVLIIADGHRAGEIISGIRSLVNKASPQKDSLNINETILEVIALARSEVQGNRIALQTQLADELPLVLGDRIQLQQVILNLVMNGIEAMGTVTDRSRELLIRSVLVESTKVLVAVQDSGTGLETESLDHLFRAFFTTKPQGMGMGLAISRSIVEAHGGKLWAVPNDGAGATFQFTLPACGKGE